MRAKRACPPGKGRRRQKRERKRCALRAPAPPGKGRRRQKRER